jgi:flagellar hook-length control protein FliK
MSFLDKLTQNLNTQTEFITKLSNISKDSRVNIGSKATSEIKLKEARNKTDNTSAQELEPEEKEDFKVEKQDFFSTAKKVFNEYKVKAEKGSEAKEPGLKEELEDASEAMDLIFALIDPLIKMNLETNEVPEIDLSAALKALEVKGEEVNLDPELLDFFLGKIDLKLGNEIENLTKEIVNLDLNTEEGVAEILELSNSIEKLQNLEKSINTIKVNLQNLINTEATKIDDKEFKPELEILLESKIEAKLKELKTSEAQITLQVQENNQAKAIKSNTEINIETTLKETVLKKMSPETKALENIETIDKNDTLKKALDEVKASIRQETAVKDTASNLEDYKVKVLKDVELKTETTKIQDYTKAEVEIIELQETSSSDSNGSQNFSNDNFETLFPKEIKVTDIKVKSLTAPVSLKQIPDLVGKEVQDLKPNTKQEVKMILNPENLGKLQLTLTRDDNQIHISMVVRTDEAANKLEQKIQDIKIILKERGFEANIEVSKSDTNNSNQAQNNQSHNRQENETRKEQKEKYLNQVPAWINKDTKKLDFSEALNRIL